MSWIAVAIVGSAAIGAGASMYSANKQAKAAESAGQPQQLQDYPEAKAARGLWWDKLQEWGNMPGYGGISPDWNNIWIKAQNRVRQYYWGGATDPGLISKVRSSAANRNVSDSPALQDMIMRMGMQEKGDIQNLATEQATQQAQFGETARTNWMNQLASLSGRQPAYTTTPNTYTPGIGEGISSFAGSIGDYYMQKEQQDWYTNLIRQQQLNQSQQYANVGGMGNVPVAPANYYSQPSGMIDPSKVNFKYSPSQ